MSSYSLFGVGTTLRIIPISMFPFHVHTPSSVEEALPMTLQKVLAYIRQQLDNASA